MHELTLGIQIKLPCGGRFPYLGSPTYYRLIIWIIFYSYYLARTLQIRNTKKKIISLIRLQLIPRFDCDEFHLFLV